MPQGKQRHARREVAVDQSSMIGRQRCHPKDGDAILLTKRNALLAAGAAALAAVAGDRAASAADANWFQNCCGSIPSEAVPGGHDANGDTLYFCRVWASAGYQPGSEPEPRNLQFSLCGVEHSDSNYDLLFPHWETTSGGI